MVRVVFRNFKKSDWMENLIAEKVHHVLSKFPNMHSAKTTVIVGMETPNHAGPDIFHVKLIALSKGLKPVVLQKDGENPYQAAANLSDRLFEVLHRALDRRREKNRSEKRRFKGNHSFAA